MGKKVFISYKYADSNVQSLLPYQNILLSPPNLAINPTTVRNYVDIIQANIGADHINKGEKDGESLSNFEDDTIASKLRDKIYDSSVTIVLISPGMVDRTKPQLDQWIPWEIAFSLREKTRADRTSRTNGVLAVVLPDSLGSYKYYIEESGCPCCNSITYRTDRTFDIIGQNMIVHKKKDQNIIVCRGVNSSKIIYTPVSTYIVTTKWSDFITNPPYWINESSSRNPEDYNLVKTL